MSDKKDTIKPVSAYSLASFLMKNWRWGSTSTRRLALRSITLVDWRKCNPFLRPRSLPVSCLLLFWTDCTTTMWCLSIYRSLPLHHYRGSGTRLHDSSKVSVHEITWHQRHTWPALATHSATHHLQTVCSDVLAAHICSASSLAPRSFHPESGSDLPVLIAHSSAIAVSRTLDQKPGTLYALKFWVLSHLNAFKRQLKTISLEHAFTGQWLFFLAAGHYR